MKTQNQTEKKLEELIVHIADQCVDHSLFGAIKLNKILFFADFLRYQSRGESITGVDYQKLPHGPAPRRMKPVLAKLESEESIFVWSRPVLADGAMRQQKRPIARRKPDLSVFSAEELALVNAVIGELQHRTAVEVSEMTHEYYGWRLAQVGETIPYVTAFLGTGSDGLTESDLAAGKKLAAALQ